MIEQVFLGLHAARQAQKEFRALPAGVLGLAANYRGKELAKPVTTRLLVKKKGFYFGTIVVSYHITDEIILADFLLIFEDIL